MSEVNAMERRFSGLSVEEQNILDQADRFAREQLYPLSPRMDKEEWWPGEAMPRIGATGYLGIPIPESHGGAGMDLFTSGLVLQAFSRWNHALALSWVAHENLCLLNIWRNANEDQRRRYVPGLCSGKLIGALGLTEPGAGSDALGSMATTATRDGDDYVLNGTKIYITNGPVADVLLVYAKTDRDKGARGISAFIVESGMPGFKVAQKLVKMGFRGSPTGELVFDECRVPAANRVGGENEGVGIMMSGLDIERVIGAFYAVGIAQRAVDLAVEYASVRKQFNRTIGEFQLVQGMLADMYTELEAMRALTYQVGREVCGLEEGQGGRGVVHKRSAAAVYYAGRACMRILDNAVQIHGGMGFMNESEVNRLYRSGKVLEIGAGTNQVRQIIIAGELLKEIGGR